MVDKVDKIWLDGKFVDWDKANVHVLTHALHYGYGAFEGTRCYKQSSGGKSAIFRLDDHLKRLLNSCHILAIKVPFSFDELKEASIEAFRVNNMEDGYIRHIVFIGDGAMGLYAVDNPIRVSIAVWKWGAYLGEDGLKNGIRAKISSFTRHHVNVSMTKGKIIGYYVNSIMAKREAMAAGYQEAIMLDTEGYIAEASGENLFTVQNGEIVTPPFSSSILGGITRNSVINLAKEMDIPVREERLSRDTVYVSDEVFFTGTAAEVTPVREVDDRPIGSGKPGPVTMKLQKAYFELVRGERKDDRYAHWLTHI